MAADRAHTTIIEEAIEEALAYFNVDGGQLSAAERVKRFEEAKKVLATRPDVAVGLLSTEFDTLSFQRKSAAYRLIIGLNGEIVAKVKQLIPGAGEIALIWLVSILHYHGDSSRTSSMVELATSHGSYAGQLAALALVFQGRQQLIEADKLVLILIDALLSTQKIEESAFFVADSSLSCLRLLTGETFLDVTPSAVHFYNFDHFLFSPPVHPFPYTSDRVNTLSLRQRRQLADRVMTWWVMHRERTKLRPLISCFDQ